MDRLSQLAFQGLHGRPLYVAEPHLVDSDGTEIARGSSPSQLVAFQVYRRLRTRH